MLATEVTDKSSASDAHALYVDTEVNLLRLKPIEPFCFSFVQVSPLQHDREPLRMPDIIPLSPLATTNSETSAALAPRHFSHNSIQTSLSPMPKPQLFSDSGAGALVRDCSAQFRGRLFACYISEP